MELSTSYGNILLVDGEYLQPNDIELLRVALLIGRSLITDAIEIQYQKYKNMAPEVQRGSIWVMRLNTEIEEVVTPGALKTNKLKRADRGIYSGFHDIKIQYAQHWHAVENAGFIPEIRELPGPSRQLKHMKGANLLVRDTPLAD